MNRNNRCTHGIGAMILVVASATGCRTQFDIAPSELPLSSHGSMTTEDGAHPVPNDYDARLVPREDSSLMSVRRGLVYDVDAVPDEHDDRAHAAGWDHDHVVFEEDSPVSREGPLLILRDEDGRIVRVPESAIRHVEVTDLDARARKIAAIVVPTTLAGGALIVGLIYFAASFSGGPR